MERIFQAEGTAIHQVTEPDICPALSARYMRDRNMAIDRSPPTVTQSYRKDHRIQNHCGWRDMGLVY